jgi:hypothetical protein
VNRRLGSSLCAIAAVVGLASCGSFDGERVARVNGTDISKDAFEDYARTQSGAVPTDGTQTRTLLASLITSKIAPAPVADADAKATYEQGFSGSPIICLAAVALAKPEDSAAVKDAIHGGTAIADIIKQYASTDQASIAPDGLVKSPDGAECYSPDQLNNDDIKNALTAVPFGEGADFTVTGASLVLALRSWDSLSADARAKVATTLGTTASLKTAKVSIDSKYGRWDQATGTVVADS